MHPADPQRLSHESVHDHSPPQSRSTRRSIQGDARGSRESTTFTSWRLTDALDPQKRHQSDRDLNSRLTKVLVGSQFEDKPWRSIRVGDVIRLESNDFFPADIVILSSSEPEGLCYIETSNLDGCVPLLYSTFAYSPITLQ